MFPKVWLLILVILISQTAVSHGGGLNSQGCHNDRKMASYHCHRSPASNMDPPKRVSGQTYSRALFNYRSYKSITSLGFYTNMTCQVVNIDHVVSLKDAFISGANKWSSAQKMTFANDRDNHVPSCSQVNSSKGSAGPRDFLRRSHDGKGLDYRIVRFCEYLSRYHSVKLAYDLSFANNSKAIFQNCGVTI